MGEKKVKLHYAEAEDVREYPNLMAIRGEVVELSISEKNGKTDS